MKPGQAAGTGAWLLLRLAVAGRRRDMGPGTFPVVGLTDARVAARQKAKGKRVTPLWLGSKCRTSWRSWARSEAWAPPALGFAILTSAPSGEVQGLRWREVDMAAAVRAVPAGRMKMREQHLVPLAGAAYAMLAARRPEPCDGAALVFAGGRADTELSAMTLWAVLRRMTAEPENGRPRWCDAAGHAVVPQ